MFARSDTGNAVPYTLCCPSFRSPVCTQTSCPKIQQNPESSGGYVQAKPQCTGFTVDRTVHPAPYAIREWLTLRISKSLVFRAVISRKCCTVQAPPPIFLRLHPVRGGQAVRTRGMQAFSYGEVQEKLSRTGFSVYGSAHPAPYAVRRGQALRFNQALDILAYMYRKGCAVQVSLWTGLYIVPHTRYADSRLTDPGNPGFPCSRVRDTLYSSYFPAGPPPP